MELRPSVLANTMALYDYTRVLDHLLLLYLLLFFCCGWNLQAKLFLASLFAPQFSRELPVQVAVELFSLSEP